MPDNSALLEAQQRVQTLYSSETFASAAHVWADRLADHFRGLESRALDVLNWEEPELNIALAHSTLTGEKPSPRDIDNWLPKFTELMNSTLAHSQNLHHPRYLGHQVPASVPIAALFDAIGSVTNQVMAIYEMGPWATAVERVMIERLGAEIGYSAGTFDGLITSGGSLANLTALLTARNVALHRVWREGIADARRLALVVQEDAHYCVTRTAGILGIGTDQIVKISVDEQRRMRTVELRDKLQSLKRDGRQIIAVVACGCATPIGAFDPLDEVANICEAEDVWMHVDAAHGGAALLSEKHRHLLKGIERADSVVWDAHKMLFMPALCAFAFYKRREHRFAAFEQDAPYLFDPSHPGIAEYDSGTTTLECTKRAAAYGLWGIWSLFGRQLFTDLVDITFDLAQTLHGLLAAAPDFEPLHTPQCNIQAFRYVPAAVRSWPMPKLGEYQLDLRRKLIRSGKAYVVPIKLDGIGALRATLINPCTTKQDILDVLDAIRRAGQEMM